MASRKGSLRLRIDQGLQAARGGAAEADQHRLAARRAERTQPRRADDLAAEAIGQDQALFRRQESAREVRPDGKVEAVAVGQIFLPLAVGDEVGAA